MDLILWNICLLGGSTHNYMSNDYDIVETARLFLLNPDDICNFLFILHPVHILFISYPLLVNGLCGKVDTLHNWDN